MPEPSDRAKLETEEIVIGYAMSRLDVEYLTRRGYHTWRDAYTHAARMLSRPPNTFKRLRDEFDPVHANNRLGQHYRPIRPNRQKVLDDLKDVSNDALLELTNRILIGDKAAVAEAIDALTQIRPTAHNVAERLLTGRRAEDYFLQNCLHLVSVDYEDILDLREAACGFDFGVKRNPELAIEIKGIKELRGDIQFTDREWYEAKQRQQDYLLVVIGNLGGDPIPRVIAHPYAILTANCQYQKSVTAVWRSRVSVL